MFFSRNDSIIVELFHGMMKSRVCCPNSNCNKISTTFDPLVFLSLPVPSFQKDFLCKIYFLKYIPFDDDNSSFDSSDANFELKLHKFDLFLNQVNIRKNIAMAIGMEIKDVFILRLNNLLLLSFF